MNGLSLRICGNSKVGNLNHSVGAAVYSVLTKNRIISLGKSFDKYLSANDAGEQLLVLQNILENRNEDRNDEIIQFLCILFCETPLKHPVKCFLLRFITKHEKDWPLLKINLQNEITSRMKKVDFNNEETFSKTLTLIIGCIENFAIGTEILQNSQSILEIFNLDAFQFCMNRMKDSGEISPSEKTKVFAQIHNLCRVMLYGLNKINGFFKEANTKNLYTLLEHLMQNIDVPMDTKSISGILFITLYRNENGKDSWIQIANSLDESLDSKLNVDLTSSKLTLLSGLITVLTYKDIADVNIGDTPAIFFLCDQIIVESERSSESTTMLCAARSILSYTKLLESCETITDGHMNVFNRILSFVWSHVDHYMDSVRHLCVQILQKIVYLSNKLSSDENNALEGILTSVFSLTRDRKAFYIGLNALTLEIGATALLNEEPDLINRLIGALSNPAVQANASTALESLLCKHSKEESGKQIYDLWIKTILDIINHEAELRATETVVSSTLESLIAKCVKYKPEVLQYMKDDFFSSENIGQSDVANLKCKLFCANVIRKTGLLSKLSKNSKEIFSWTQLISLDSLKMAMIYLDDVIRLLALSLIVETPKTTEILSEEEKLLFIWFLKYNINSQSPSFRQKSLAFLMKLLNRYRSSMEVLMRNKNANINDSKFILDVRSLCVENLTPGSNYSRRTVSLTILKWLYDNELFWKNNESVLDDFLGKTEVERKLVPLLLYHLKDSFESNKKMALDILKRPSFKHNLLNLSSILREASSVNPTDCITAAYKLEYIIHHRHESLTSVLSDCEDLAYDVDYLNSVSPNCLVLYVIRKLLNLLQRELDSAKKSILIAASNGPMYGLVYCIRHLYLTVDVRLISDDKAWTDFISELIETCFEINKSVECVVNNSSPEGHIPMDFENGELVVDGTIVKLGKGAKVSAQMVLLCAWRSVKEVSLLLSELATRSAIDCETGSSGNLTGDQILLIGEHFTILLAETKHRGAFEQAYVGFCKLCSRLWSCKSRTLHTLPRVWLDELMEAIQHGDKAGKLCATRRSAGVPFMIQALVTTELELSGSTKCFEGCMSTLLRLASDTDAASVETRTHSLNILRALYRHTKLGEAVNPYVADGLLTAVRGFDGQTWAERNSSTLLFSSLMVRIFGVQRSKDSDKLCIRNKMTGRIFFLRYPQLYDFMLETLRTMTVAKSSQLLNPSLYPVLLILARLYPSSLEGTVSNLKLVEFVPYVLACAESCVLKTRQLAAKAIVSLISPENYLDHLRAMLSLLHDVKIKKNYSHGVLLQITSLLNNRPNNLTVNSDTIASLVDDLNGTLWMLEELFGETPCFTTVDAYFKMVHIISWRFPEVICPTILEPFKSTLRKIFQDNFTFSKRFHGREIFLQNCLYLYAIILLQTNDMFITKLIVNQLRSKDYEVVLASLNFIMLLYEETEIDCSFQRHIKSFLDPSLRNVLRNEIDYITNLTFVYFNSICLECKQKAAKLLCFEPNSYDLILETKHLNTDEVFDKLMEKISKEDMLLTTLNSFLTNEKHNLSNHLLVSVLRSIFSFCSADCSTENRMIVVNILENNLDSLWFSNQQSNMKSQEYLEYNAIFWAALIVLLEDDEPEIRQRTSDVILKIYEKIGSEYTYQVLPSFTSDITISCIKRLYEKEVGIVILLILALLDFNSVVCLSDDESNECRVFDQGEKHNTFLEESQWTTKCLETLKDYESKIDMSFVDKVINRNECLFMQLCWNNVVTLREMSKNHFWDDSTVNPKLKWFRCLVNPNCDLSIFL